MRGVQGMQKAVVAETAPTSSADSSASVAHSAGTSGECGPYRKKRNDFEEQAELVDVLNMLSQLYRDQVWFFLTLHSLPQTHVLASSYTESSQSAGRFLPPAHRDCEGIGGSSSDRGVHMTNPHW